MCRIIFCVFTNKRLKKGMVPPMMNRFYPTALDYPDPDLIRVDDTYYMVSTTMYFMPGCEILRSYDLLHWEHAAYVYETLADTPAQHLQGEQHIYGKGMWAPTFRFHNGKFYICFVANDTHKTYLFTAEKIEGPWKKQYIEGFFHDSSLLFDDDGRVYIMYGNTQVYLTELNKDLTAPQKGGFHKMILEDKTPGHLGYEGSHLYKINGKYVAMVCHMPAANFNRKVQSCFIADTLDGEFKGGIVLDDDRGFRNLGVAQGGLVDTPDGQLVSVMFQDVGAAGRIPVLVPVKWENGSLVFGENGKVPLTMQTTSTNPAYCYEPLIGSDTFVYTPAADGKITLRQGWQWNHAPDDRLWLVTEKPGSLRIYTGKTCTNVTQAVNTLTQRMLFPHCSAEVTLDASRLNEGDYAGFCALQGCYSMAAITKDQDNYYLVLLAKKAKDSSIFSDGIADQPAAELARIPLSCPQITLRMAVDFGETEDFVRFYFQAEQQWAEFGPACPVYFKMDHFTGCRFALAVFSSQTYGGYADFTNFVYHS